MKSMTAEQRNHMLLCDPVSRVIPKLAVPTIISMLITNIYNMADTFFVSQIGTSASGAVGVIFSAMAIIQAVSFMIGMGAGTHVSQALGAGNREKGRRLRLHVVLHGVHRGRHSGVFQPDEHRRRRSLPRLDGDHRPLRQGLCHLHLLRHAVYDVLVRDEQPAAL